MNAHCWCAQLFVPRLVTSLARSRNFCQSSASFVRVIHNHSSFFGMHSEMVVVRFIAPVGGKGWVALLHVCFHCHRFPIYDCICWFFNDAREEAVQMVVPGRLAASTTGGSRSKNNHCFATFGSFSLWSSPIFPSLVGATAS